MTEKNEYSGAALQSFVLALSGSQTILDKLLKDAGVEKIDPEAWYDYDRAISIFYQIEQELGRDAVIEVGRKMIESAIYPPEITSIETLLPALGDWFLLNARGPSVGTITCEFEDEHSAVIDWSARGLCSIDIGILEGACRRYGVKPLIEHAPGGCKDDGALTCIFHVSW